jgi:hypothetical protein
LKIPWSSIPNQLNIELWNWKKNLLYTKELKKQQLKEWRLKYEWKINLYVIEEWNWKEKLIWQKDKKTIKRMRIEIDIKNKKKSFIEWWNWKE